ncbi:MAG: 2-dehydro-3-deoxygalactonokinase [Alphaproteobacteria bacterium]|nr:2-dehydro-3-deoxygalactonokinase [Alphaproteobacteria bacterium]
MTASPSLIALDWGTTSLRAYLLARDESVLARLERPQGILNVPDRNFDAAFAEAVGGWIGRGMLPAIASGMIGSRQGWREAPYADCPAGLDALAKALLPVETTNGVALRIVPGVALVDADGVPDVMRGEETQILGQFAAGESGVAVLPGTHSKWVLVEQGRIGRFATFMTGEAFAALKGHTILGRLMTGDALDGDAFGRGVDHAAHPQAGRGGLLHRIFSARTLGLFDRVKGDALHSYLSGLMIGAEIAEALAWLVQSPTRVTVIGAPELSALYVSALARRGIASTLGLPDAAARGLLRIARAAGLVA